METPRNSGLGPLDDVALVQRIVDRRQEALGHLYDRYAGTILALGIRILGDSAEAEDVLQETMLQAWNQARHYDPRRSAVSTWLVLIARSRAIDRLRSRRVKQRTAAAAHAENPGAHTSPRGVEDVLFKERRERVRAELEGLPPEQRSVLEMAFYQGLTQSEIAGQTGIPLGTVKTRTLLAMKKLRVALRDEIRELL